MNTQIKNNFAWSGTIDNSIDFRAVHFHKISNYLRYVQVPFPSGSDPDVLEKKVEWWDAIKGPNNYLNS